MNLLITGAWQSASEHMEQLNKMGHNVCFLQWEKDELPCDYSWVEGIIGNGIFLSHPIEKFVNLKYIQLTSAGFDRVPMDYVNTHGITIHNARGVYSIPMAEFAIGGVLQLYKDFYGFRDSQKNHEWKKNRNIRELHESKVCIIGCGSVGTECAKRFKAFGAIVNGVDLYPRIDSSYNYMAELSSLDEMISDADVVVMTVPMSEDTKKLMNKERMLLLKDNAVVVNIARGGVMDYEAFIELKAAGKQIQAVLDVFEEEPLGTDSPLWDMDGVIVTPHNSFVGEHNKERLSQVVMNNLTR